MYRKRNLIFHTTAQDSSCYIILPELSNLLFQFPSYYHGNLRLGEKLNNIFFILRNNNHVNNPLIVQEGAALSSLFLYIYEKFAEKCVLCPLSRITLVCLIVSIVTWKKMDIILLVMSHRGLYHGLHYICVSLARSWLWWQGKCKGIMMQDETLCYHNSLTCFLQQCSMKDPQVMLFSPPSTHPLLHWIGWSWLSIIVSPQQ